MNENVTQQADYERHYECVQFYNREAELLDAKKLEAWLELLTEDVRYDMPIRVTRDRSTDRSEFSDHGFNYREDRSTLEARVDRFQSEFAWSEDPPSRTRHFVTNVRVTDVDGDELTVKNNLLLYQAQGEEADGTILSAERHDVLRRVDGTLKLAERDIHLDHTVLPIKNISVFF
ncbi:aromatic-ring-hydroxylating dioxygenase subunit beta [Natrinema gelatinilyticum]|uniref:aromatic-ring-hydroxylating dioxygenase subunit beta n=1 Tax=Natrinema gelatinilyticum TaxID=2961571 RepID=UPI0020C34199|nr:3-phenylpropionate/cinnamic acid dioxygenase subunit beta [Natrinema gelatinilyticum]